MVFFLWFVWLIISASLIIIIFFFFSFLFFGYCWRNRKEFQWASTARVSLCARDPNDKMKRKKQKKRRRKIRIIDITFKKEKKIGTKWKEHGREHRNILTLEVVDFLSFELWNKKATTKKEEKWMEFNCDDDVLLRVPKWWWQIDSPWNYERWCCNIVRCAKLFPLRKETSA